ncbi:unnamed protein product [Echinostoma caproni]|uniref:Peptidase_M22 domain-containing protein n=1 Tax=Echinostoma caproni TaxID=27848 RepID=A0A183A1I9_9TREM|nr:unnamed protein product [Echinostoma caproni]
MTSLSPKWVETLLAVLSVPFHRTRFPYMQNFHRFYILGLETSCDDTGAAVLNRTGEIVSECVQSQTKFTSIIFNLPFSVATKELDAIAVTVKPGMPLSLKVGVNYAKEIARQHALPIIPVHHMEAHALMIIPNYTLQLSVPLVIGCFLRWSQLSEKIDVICSKLPLITNRSMSEFHSLGPSRRDCTLTWCDGLCTSLTQRATQDGSCQADLIMPGRSMGRGQTRSSLLVLQVGGSTRVRVSVGKMTEDELIQVNEPLLRFTHCFSVGFLSELKALDENPNRSRA